MIKTFVLAGVSIVASFGVAIACDMHGKDHVSLQTTETVPAPVVVPTPKPQPIVLQSTPVPTEEQGMSVSKGSEAGGCLRKRQTVYYTN